MKTLISLMVSLIIAFLLIYFVDGAIVNYIISKIPNSAGEWIGLIKAGIWIIILVLTSGIVIWISVAIGLILNAILED